MENFKVSILIPAYNVEKYIVECVNSIIAQTYSNWELIVVDDFSLDNTFQILKDFEQKDNRISVFKNTAKGIIPALQLAYSKSTGALITRMDADDIMYPHKIEVLANNLIEKGRGNIATGKVEYFVDNGVVGDGFVNYEHWLNSLTEKGTNYSEIYKECVIPSPCWMVFREDFELSGGFNSTIYPEDYDLCFRFYEQELKVIPCSKVLHKWRDYAQRTSRNDDNYADNRFLDIKTRYFLLLSYNSAKELVLLGAGKKGKQLAQILISKNIEFTWLTNNANKIGHNIYGVVLKELKSTNINTSSQFIIAISNPEEQLQVKEELYRQINPENVFLFF